jgi:hypothetical protein
MRLAAGYRRDRGRNPSPARRQVNIVQTPPGVLKAGGQEPSIGVKALGFRAFRITGEAFGLATTRT